MCVCVMLHRAHRVPVKLLVSIESPVWQALFSPHTIFKQLYEVDSLNSINNKGAGNQVTFLRSYH